MTLKVFFKYFSHVLENYFYGREKSLLNKELKAEISRFARDDPTTSPRADFARSLRINRHPERREGFSLQEESFQNQ
jgi:hypothetical protein